MQIDVPAHHHVADLFVADWAEEFDAVLQHALFEHLLEVDAFGARAGNDEAHVGVAGENSGDGGYEEVGAFVVEEARYHYYGYCVVGAEMLRWWVSVLTGGDGGVFAAGVVVKRPEVFCYDRVWNDGDHERV